MLQHPVRGFLQVDKPRYVVQTWRRPVNEPTECADRQDPPGVSEGGGERFDVFLAEGFPQKVILHPLLVAEFRLLAPVSG